MNTLAKLGASTRWLLFFVGVFCFCGILRFFAEPRRAPERNISYHAVAIERYSFLSEKLSISWEEFSQQNQRNKDNLPSLRFAGPWILGGWYLLVGPGFDHVFWLNLLFLLASVIGIYFVGKQLESPIVGAFAAGLLSLSAVTLYMIDEFSNELLLMPLFIWLWFLISTQGAWRSITRTIGIAFLLICGAAIRLDFLLLTIPLVCWSLYHETKQRSGIPPGPALGLIVFAFAAFLILLLTGTLDSLFIDVRSVLTRNDNLMDFFSGDSKGGFPAIVTHLLFFLPFTFWTPVMIPVLVLSVWSYRRGLVKGPVAAALIGSLLPLLLQSEYPWNWAFLSLPVWAFVVAAGIAIHPGRLKFAGAMIALSAVLVMIVPVGLKLMGSGSIDPGKKQISPLQGLAYLYNVNRSGQKEKAVFEALSKIKMHSNDSKKMNLCLDLRSNRKETNGLLYYYNRMIEPRQMQLSVVYRNQLDMKDCQAALVEVPIKNKQDFDASEKESMFLSGFKTLAVLPLQYLQMPVPLNHDISIEYYLDNLADPFNYKQTLLYVLLNDK